MITLEMNKAREFKVGEVLHLKVVDLCTVSPGRWRLIVEDVTPLPGAEPTAYGCLVCGIIEDAQPDGSLPKGWVKKDYEEGSGFVCPDCMDEPICRVCGCSQYNPCMSGGLPCYWVEEDLCSECSGKEGIKR